MDRAVRLFPIPMERVTRKIARLLSNLRTAQGLSRPDSVGFEAMAVGDLVVRCQSAWPTDLADWNDLIGRVPTAGAFHSPAWQIASWTAGRIRGRLRFVTVHRASELLAVLPLCVDGSGAVHTPGASISDYLDPLIRPDAEPQCWRAILGFIAAQWDHSLEVLTLYNLRPNARCRALLPSMAGEAGFTLEESVVDQSPVIALPSTWEDYLDSLDGHERKEIRRKLNKAETKGVARYTRCTDPVEIPALLAQTIAMMESAGGEKGEAIRGYIRPLLEAVGLPLIREGRMGLNALYIQEELACCLIDFPTAAGPLLYNMGFDAAKKEWSPGVVAIAMSIRQAIQQGAVEYDMLRGQEPHKYKFGAVDRPLYRITMRRR